MMNGHLGLLASTFMKYMAVVPTFGAAEASWAQWSVNEAKIKASNIEIQDPRAFLALILTLI